MCRTPNCENCQQKQNPTPQQIRRFPFPQCQSHKNSEQPWRIFLLFIFFYFLKSTVNRSSRISILWHLRASNSKSRHCWEKALISAEIQRKCYISPQQKTCNWKFQWGSNGLRHSSKTWLLDCSILNEDFFSGDHWSLPGAQRCRLLLCGSLQGAEDKKNEKWHCGEAEHSRSEKVDMLAPKHCLFRLSVLRNGVFCSLDDSKAIHS